MQKIVLFISCFISTLSFGQITLTSSDMPVVNTNHFYATSNDFSTVDVNATGANYNWDFSSITSNGIDTVALVEVTSTPVAYQLYFNNAILYPDYKADYASKGTDISAFGQVNITDRYDFYRVDSDALRLTGFGANINGLPASVKYDTIDQIYPLPMTYQTTDSTTAYYLLSIPNLGTYGQWIRRKVEVDGWGTLNTPSNTYQNVLRVKTTLYQRDTLFVDQLGFGSNFDRPVEHFYEWFAQGEPVPVLQVIERGNQLTQMKYKDQSLQINDNETQPVAVYPNPVQEQLNFSENFTGELRLMDLNGVLVESWNSSELNHISLSCLPAGVYILQFNDSDGSQQIRLVKL